MIKTVTLFTLIILFITSCSNKQINVEILDIENIEQKPYIYTGSIEKFDENTTNTLKNDFVQKYFSPWDLNISSYSLEAATWANMYANSKVYSENHRLISKEWFEKNIENSNFESYNTISKKAITITNTHLKAFPTKSKIFYDPKKAGEGFPFDYNENSSIKINSPIFVSHYSKDGLWVFVESSFALGWIELKDVGFVDDEFISIFKNGKYYINTKDNVVLHKNGFVVDFANLGTLFPKAQKGFIISGKNYMHQAFIKVIDADNNFEEIGLEFNIENISKISSELIGQRYGWGGLLDNRDCSLMIKDFYAPFGIYLQRNSSGQKKDGQIIDVSTFDNKIKKDFILKNAIPFKTLIYLKGHIMIYIGSIDNEPLVFHNMWGVKTLKSDGKAGRQIVGKAVVTTLEPGKELDEFSDKRSILSKIESITILGK